MGSDVSEKGFHIVLSPRVPDLIRENLGRDVDALLAEKRSPPRGHRFLGHTYREIGFGTGNQHRCRAVAGTGPMRSGWLRKDRRAGTSENMSRH
jgi:hypothetical protein